METGTRFVSKVDTWLAVVMLGSLVLMLASAVFVWIMVPGWQRWSGVGMLLFVLALTFGVIVPMYYEIGEDALLVRSGLLRSRLLYTKITKVEPSGNPLSSPALSLDRLHVHVEDGFGALISPKEREDFLVALLARCPQLRRDGDRLVRK